MSTYQPDDHSMLDRPGDPEAIAVRLDAIEPPTVVIPVHFDGSRVVTERTVESPDVTLDAEETDALLDRIRQQEDGDDPAADAAPSKPRPSAATVLLRLAIKAGVELFHATDGNAYATVPVGDHHETHPIRTGGSFTDWLRRQYHAGKGGAVPDGALRDALATLGAMARFDGGTHEVAVRVAGQDGALYLDLGDDEWRSVEVTTDGWSIVSRSPVRFRRPRGMLAIPMPLAAHERPGGVELLRRHVNLTSDLTWRLLAGWLVGACRATGPYPLLMLHGEQGSAKSTTARMLRSLIDPHASPLRAEPKDVDALMIAATSGWVPTFDNLSTVAPWLSDALSRLATGGGLSKRMLFTDGDEYILDAMRPVIVTGIAELATRGDLLDRSILLELPLIPERSRRTEAQLWARFERDRPAILGGLLDALSFALAFESLTILDRLPRMADFARWVAAAEPALGWEHGAFLDAYAVNRASAHEVAVDSSPVASMVRGLGPFEGTSAELLELLDKRMGVERVESLTRAKLWPKSARGLGDALRRAAPNLRALGVEVAFSREAGTGRRVVTVTPVQDGGATVTTVTTVTPSTGPVTQTPQGVTQRDADEPSLWVYSERDRVARDGRDADAADAHPESDGAPRCDCGKPKVSNGDRWVCTNGSSHAKRTNGMSIEDDYPPSAWDTGTDDPIGTLG